MKLYLLYLYVGASIRTATILERIPDYLRQLCPKSNVCDVNGYMGDKNGDPDSCCTDCSCKPDCSDNGDCCFGSRTQASELSTIDVITPLVTTGEDRAQCLYPVTGNSEVLDFLNFFSYNMLSSSNGKNAFNKNESCANKTVAPWGSLYPVYSKQTNKIYINDICAKEDNVTDGFLWKAFFTCKSTTSRHTDIAALFTGLEKGKVPMLCRIYFTYPGESTDIRSHVCYKNMIDQCSAVEFQVPPYLNATKKDISEACQSGLISPYYSTFDLYANVFCLICSGLRFNINERCAEKQPGKGPVGQTNFAALLDPVAISTMTNLTVKGPMACRINTHQNASHCRPVLCPSAQIRNANGNCVFPAKVWYQHLYSIAVELRSEQTIDLKEAFHWLDDRDFISYIDIRHFNLANSMPLTSWTVDNLFYESKQQDTSRTTHTLLVILNRNFGTSDPANIIRNMSLLISMNWLLSYMNESLVLKPSISKLKSFAYDQGLLTSGRFKVNASYSEMYLSYKHLYTSGQRGIIRSFMTKLYFCDQIELRNSEYIISTDKKVLYINTFSKMYLFDGEFDFDYGNSESSIKICLENSGFVKSIVACANVHTQPALYRLYILQVLLCFVFLKRHGSF